MRGRGVVVQHAGLSRRRPWVQIPSIPPIVSGSSSEVEHCLAKAAVAGSNPVFRSIFIYREISRRSSGVEQLIRNQLVVCSNQIAGSR